MTLNIDGSSIRKLYMDGQQLTKLYIDSVLVWTAGVWSSANIQLGASGDNEGYVVVRVVSSDSEQTASKTFGGSFSLMADGSSASSGSFSETGRSGNGNLYVNTGTKPKCEKSYSGSVSVNDNGGTGDASYTLPSVMFWSAHSWQGTQNFTANNNGTHYRKYKCDNCSDTKDERKDCTEVTDSSAGGNSSGYFFDTNNASTHYRWRVCKYCGGVVGMTTVAHTYSGNTCRYCGYTKK